MPTVGTSAAPINNNTSRCHNLSARACQVLRTDCVVLQTSTSNGATNSNLSLFSHMVMKVNHCSLLWVTALHFLYLHIPSLDYCCPAL